MNEAGSGGGSRISPLDRERVALLEVGQTEVQPGVARAMVGWFLLMLAALPLLEVVGAGRTDGREATAWSRLIGIGGEIERRLATLRVEEPAAGVWPGVVAANRAALGAFSAFESALEDQSTVGRLLRPPAQLALSGWLGAGNERVYVGTAGWLFYRPDVEYVTGSGFLDPRAMRRRLAAASEHQTVPQPDPRPAIRRFQQDLAARGISLVLMPTPVKPTLHGDRLAPGRAASSGPLQNVSFDRFVEEMLRDGVLVFDPSAVLAGSGNALEASYLATDTHWRPEAMQRVAESLAGFIRDQVRLPPIAPPGYGVERREARQPGDIAAMLDLPPGQRLYPPERVTLRMVVDAAGDPWRSSRAGDVLVLGDSFSNIYSLASMGWGESAGLVEQVSYILQRPIDRLVQNDDGAYATRALLQREAGGDSDRLAGKRVVIWQFAARELAFGNWQVLPLR